MKRALLRFALWLSGVCLPLMAYGQAINGPGGSGFKWITTITANSQPSIQFTNLPNYPTLFFNCSGLMLSAASNHIAALVGEGAGPTWETGLNYSIANYYVTASGTNGTNHSLTAADLGLHGGTFGTAFPTDLQLYIYNVASSSLAKSVAVNAAYTDTTAAAFVTVNGWAYWNLDTNPITGIEIIPDSGNIVSGTCSEYGGK